MNAYLSSRMAFASKYDSFSPYHIPDLLYNEITLSDMAFKVLALQEWVNYIVHSVLYAATNLCSWPLPAPSRWLALTAFSDLDSRRSAGQFESVGGVRNCFRTNFQISLSRSAEQRKCA